MAKLEFIATATFGLESIVKQEVQNLGFPIVSVEDGKITFEGDESAIPKANYWLRSADRVLLKLGEFRALTFDQLFEKTKSLPWAEWIPVDGKFTVTGKSVKSQLHSVPDCQSIVKKAVVEKLKEKYDVEWFREDGAEFTIQVSLLKDVATLTIDTTGVGLHKRGYRELAVEAPLKETLAAALIQLSYWKYDRIFLDPFCGSGTIPIEAALIGKNIAPGLNRSFVSEDWPRVPKKLWKQAKVDALKSIQQDRELIIFGSDIDSNAIHAARENAINAGVDDCITFSTKPLSEVQVQDSYGVVICNPPYGERIGDQKDLEILYKEMGNLFKVEDTWSLYVITSDERFERLYGRKASKKRKLFNGRIKVDYYQYFGKRPPRS